MTRARIVIGLTGAALTAAIPALAAAVQDAAPRDPARTTRIEQIPAHATPPAADAPLPAPDVRPPAQISLTGERTAPAQVGGSGPRRSPVPQLNHDPRSASAAPQLYRGKRTAQASDPLSSPKQSRPAAVVRLEGKDRCDPEDARAAARTACRRVIETRSAEFTRPNPLVLSPEQKLMVDQRLRQLPTTAESAVQRIGRNDVDAGDSDAQNVASLVLPQTPATLPAKEKDMPTGLDAEVLSVIQALAGATPTTPVVTPQ